MENLKKKTKRASVVFFNQFNDVGDEAKRKYQTLLEEHLELQKEFVSRKKKLQAAKQKKEAMLAEIRFLRRRRNYLSINQVPKSYLQSNAVLVEINHSTFEAAPENHDQILVPNAVVKNEETEGKVRVNEDDIRFTKKLKSRVVIDKSASKRNISRTARLSQFKV